MTVLLRLHRGHTRELAIDDWAAPATAGELELLDHAPGPVLDLGCGPGRLVAALAARGVPALGIDASPAAVLWADERGAPVLCHSIFDALPGEGRWGSVLLLDGNIGIGGDPLALLGRVRQLLRAGGRAIVELEPPGTRTYATAARLERDSERTAWFPWAFVAIDHIDELAALAGLQAVDRVAIADRWFALLSREEGR